VARSGREFDAARELVDFALIGPHTADTEPGQPAFEATRPCSWLATTTVLRKLERSSPEFSRLVHAHEGRRRREGNWNWSTPYSDSGGANTGPNEQAHQRRSRSCFAIAPAPRHGRDQRRHCGGAEGFLGDACDCRE